MIDSLMAPLYAHSFVSTVWQEYINDAITIAILTIIVLATAKIAHIVLTNVIRKIVKHTKTTWDDRLFESHFFLRLSRFVPALILYLLIPFFFPDDKGLITQAITVYVKRFVIAYMQAMVVYTAAAFLDGLYLFYQKDNAESAKKRPIKGYIQLVKVFLYIIGLILVVTTIVNVSPVGILSGIGAMSAVLMLVFKDSIVGFVSSMQLSANDMVRIGDWIEMPKYNADGDVIDVTLQSVVVQNWDKTISTIPIYALVSDSFRNWRGMTEFGGRRIKRSIYIDMRSVHFLSYEEINILSQIPLIADYMKQKTAEIEKQNKALNIDSDDYVSGRHLTNLGTFRAYAEAYIASLSTIDQDKIHIVRQLQPDANGLPLELYLFTNDIRWIYYENIQSDIFDHLLSIIPIFGLRVFQNPSAADLQMIAHALRSSAS
ncbi:MAG: mechanosensitive ion channel family protein [Spirochaetaceae bacterium]|jgi:miniconductance mechanosensitive channel|nr:mechanosensitive ion channel family protein [Spirochaetaceae bacterium]